MSGWTQDRPNRSQRQVPQHGEPAAKGWTAAHESCRNPGSVSSSVRAPPPAVSAASTTSTVRPAWARVTAAVSPFGPAPTTIASNSAMRQRYP